MQATAATRAPTSYWVIAVLSLMWNAFGAFDYVMTNTRNEAYLSQPQFPPEMIDYIDRFPVWAIAAWAFGVWGAVAGSVLLLLRSRFAVHAFAVSLAGLALSTIYQATSDMPASMTTPGMIGMTLVIWIAALFFLWYSIRMRRQGVLR